MGRLWRLWEDGEVVGGSVTWKRVSDSTSGVCCCRFGWGVWKDRIGVPLLVRVGRLWEDGVDSKDTEEGGRRDRTGR